MIELAADYPLPLRFHLKMGRSRVPVQVIWQNGYEAGVRFDTRARSMSWLALGRWFPSRKSGALPIQVIELGRRKKGG